MIGDFLSAIGDILIGADKIPTSRRQWAFVLTLMGVLYVLCFAIAILMESSDTGATIIETYSIAPKAFRVTFILSLVLIPLGASYGWPSRSRR